MLGIAEVPAQPHHQRQRQQAVEWSVVLFASQSQVAKQSADAEYQSDHRSIEDGVPHVAARLIVIDVYKEELIFVHLVRHPVVQGTQWDYQRRNLY